jgi:Mg2+/Co2+ transporter CorC
VATLLPYEKYEDKGYENCKIGFQYQLLLCVYDVNLLGENVNSIKNIETLLDTSKEVSLEVIAEKTQYMFIYHHLNARQVCQLINPSKHSRVQIFGNERKQIKFHLQRNQMI